MEKSKTTQKGEKEGEIRRKRREFGGRQRELAPRFVLQVVWNVWVEKVGVKQKEKKEKKKEGG